MTSWKSPQTGDDNTDHAQGRKELKSSSFVAVKQQPRGARGTTIGRSRLADELPLHTKEDKDLVQELPIDTTDFTINLTMSTNNSPLAEKTLKALAAHISLFTETGIQVYCEPQPVHTADGTSSIALHLDVKEVDSIDAQEPSSTTLSASDNWIVSKSRKRAIALRAEVQHDYSSLSVGILRRDIDNESSRKRSPAFGTPEPWHPESGAEHTPAPTSSPLSSSNGILLSPTSKLSPTHQAKPLDAARQLSIILHKPRDLPRQVDAAYATIQVAARFQKTPVVPAEQQFVWASEFKFNNFAKDDAFLIEVWDGSHKKHHLKNIILGDSGKQERDRKSVV